jgi:uncharacterized protein (TIGR00661 family)
MATILYGVNGEGSGHSTRAKEVILHLQEQGHTVHVASSDRGLRNLSEFFDVTEIYGLRFAYVNNRVRYERTVAKNLKSAPRAARSVRRLGDLAKQRKVDLVCTDFEPLTCHVGHQLHLPIISIDNQHCLTNASVSYPKEFRRDAAAAKLVTRLMTPRANVYLAISFFPAKAKKNNTYLLPPILRREILGAKPSIGDHVLVYVTSPSPDLAALLQQVRSDFRCYGFGREGHDANIAYKKPSAAEFQKDLVSCKGVIANTGFSLVSEALHLGKPYLGVPVKHQFEQVFNAYYLEQSGYGPFWQDLNKERIESFLFNLDLYRQQLASYPRQDNSLLFAKLDQLIAQYTQERMKVKRARV